MSHHAVLSPGTSLYRKRPARNVSIYCSRICNVHDVHVQTPLETTTEALWRIGSYTASKLKYYASDGWAELDNNLAENALRTVSLGRKNWLFFGSDHGGDRGALLCG